MYDFKRDHKGHIIWDKTAIEEFTKLFNDPNISNEDLAMKLGYVGPDSVRARAKALKIIKPQARRNLTITEDIAEYIKVQLKDCKKTSEIAKSLDVDMNVLTRHMKKYGIEKLYGYDPTTHKRCLSCKKIFPYEDFPMKKRETCYRPAARCRECHNNNIREKLLHEKMSDVIMNGK